MKLNEIKPVLSESSTPIHITMVLKEVIDAGKITNMAQTLVLSQIVQLFKFAPVDANNQYVQMQQPNASLKPRYVYENPTSKQLIDDIKGLAPEDAVKLSAWCLVQLGKVEAAEDLEQYRDPQMALSQWIAYVCKAQD